jgi:MoxR-like ATPase
MTVISPAPVNPDLIVEEATAAASKLAEVRNALSDVIFGQETVLERALTTVLAGGHGLLVGVPGLAKTKLVDAMGYRARLAAGRIQFTPDLMPSDILGSEILEEAADRSRSFRFVRGPIFAQLLMADEINRASPRTQSALLQAMQEHHVTIAGQRHDLPQPFHVLARRIPSTGGHLSAPGGAARPLPDADRRALPGYRRRAPHAVRDHRAGERPPRPVLSAQGLMAIQNLVRRMPVGEAVVEAILRLVRQSAPARRAAKWRSVSPGAPGREPAMR